MENFKLAKYIHSEQAIFNLAMKELPMEYAVELNRLISYEMEGSVG